MGADVVLAPRGRNDFDILSGSGAVVWELLEEPATEGELVEQLTELFETAPEQIAADLRELLAALENTGAIEPAGRMAGLAGG